MCRALGRSADPQFELETLGHQLDAAYQTMATNLPTNTAVRIERTDGRDRLVLTPLDVLPVPPSLLALRAQVAQRLPRADIPDPLLEIHARTGFAEALIPLSSTQFNFLGRYHFALPEALAQGGFRPLRDPERCR